MTMAKEHIRQAMAWYSQQGFDLITIAQHYGVSVEELKQNMCELYPLD